MKKSSIILIAIIAVAIAMILVIYTDSSTYSTFSEAKEKQTELYVVGVLNKQKELHYDPIKDANRFSFYMYDNDSTECQVVFNGSKPQDIERSEQLVLTGKMEGNIFHASKILMKCPSKYNQDEVEVIETNAAPQTAMN
ncbi:cytochrome c maturation protein CcmE domain-containing protein [Sphingobacterium psychroaquaticum]|uniref:Cytochrome c-type biogenesis protein CcmE n=1 Tax=Sphingobacterium psychroaquaticum TaxID=561061 RepID=A0A1X7L6X7_9SPHI|nr:cytochrome c maturation protein CcmE [Sphingobacterium psychroaquaticum]QBQ42301.1 cytochrome c maturation protein CcmE [Sphingobacterium psychroaquaticum]SMG48992.1 cytochrome c-type biogenesis protein CcmE [Sphingobacterium psychroaquaticum]